MRKNGDDSVSYEESMEEKNYFAIKKVYEGSLDGKTWYGSGDIAYYRASKNLMLESTILEVECDGSILIENELGISTCSVKEMKAGCIVLSKESDCKCDRALAIRYKEQFTIDLSNWFTEGQKCIIETKSRTLSGAIIMGMTNEGNIHISCDGEDDILHYSEIINIIDLYANTSYLILNKTRSTSLRTVQSAS